MAETKTLLREARDAIKNKDYETSLRLSKSILKDDKSNYMALLFLGLSLQEIGPVEQAPKAFRKAIELNPTNPLAFNGLISYYEKNNTEEAKEELVRLYCKILDIETTEKKIIEFCNKLAALTEDGNITDVVHAVYNVKHKIKDQFVIYEVIVKLLDTVKTQFPSELESIYEECLSSLINSESASSNSYYASYLKLLYKQEKFTELLKYAEKMRSLFETDSISLVWICKVYTQMYFEDREFAEQHKLLAEDCYKKLLEIDPNNPMGLFTHGVILLQSGKLLEARDMFVKVTIIRSGLLHAWIALTFVNVRLNLREEAIQAAEMSEKLLASKNCSKVVLRNILDALLIELYSKSSLRKEWKKAVEIYDRISRADVNEECLKNVIMVYIKLDHVEKAKSLMQDVKDANLSRFLRAQLYIQEQKLRDALQLLEEDTPDESVWWYEIGVTYWKLGEYKNCLMPFLRAVKCDPYNFSTFFHLGNYYQKVDDPDKARRCYEKAFSINPNSQELVIELSSIYRKLKQFDSAQNLLENLTTRRKDSWAHLQLGLSYLEQEDHENAIDKLRYVVRTEPENPHSWESLADAYFARGSYTSAMKCYQRSVELSTDALYPSLQVANIKKILGQFPEAIADFKTVLLENGSYIPALKGLAETYVRLAVMCYRNQRFGTSRDHIQSALDNLTTAVTQAGEYSCLWKLLGDGCLFVTKLPEQHCCLFMTESLLEGSESEEKRLVEKEDIFVCATRFYCMAINLTEDNVLIWHDLANCYLTHALNITDTCKKNLLLSYSMAAVKHCTTVNPTNWQHWNVMGNIAMHQEPSDYSLAQHAFIKAVTMDGNCAVAWANLGTLYLMMGDIKLANKAFAQGQRSDPNHVHSWIGQALVAESVGHEEAMDLFRHSTQISHHQQGSIGYGHWVCQTLLDSDPDEVIYAIHNMHAVSVACDGLTWYTEINPDDSCAWNMLGILRERLHLKLGTLEAYKNAYRISPKETRDKARVNYGRVLFKAEKYREAIDIFQEVQEATFRSGSGLALALFKDKRYEESYNAYEQSLHWLTDDKRNQSELLVALASMTYKFQDADAAKTLLFQSINLKPLSPWGLYATLSLALLHDDNNLAKLVFDELEAFKDNAKCLPHYATLISYFYVKQGHCKKAKVMISKLIHRHPDSPSVWLTLAMLLLRMKESSESSNAAVKCAQATMVLGRSRTDVTKVLGLVSLSHLLAGNLKQAVIAAQKAIHCYPHLADGWATLGSALMDRKDEQMSKLNMEKIFDYVESLNVSEEYLTWARRQRQKCAV